jgi:hypothetical protein
MTIYVEYDGEDFSYESSIAPRVGENIIYEQENEGITQYFRVLSVAYYTNGGYNEIHIKAELEYEENLNE